MEPMAKWSRAPDIHMPFGPKDLDEVSKQGEEAEPKTMQLNVLWSYHIQEAFQCKPDSKLEKLMLASCERRGVALQDVQFLFDGKRIGMNDTPHKLGVEDGDIIEAVLIRCTKCGEVGHTSSSRLCPLWRGGLAVPGLDGDALFEAARVAQMDVASSELEDSAEATRSRMASPTAELDDSAEAATRLATHEREKGIRRMHEGDYRAALDHFVTALKCFSKLQGRSRAAPDANTYSLAQAACVFYGVDVAQRLLPDVLCKKARVLCLLGAHEDALEATEDAAALHPRLLKPACVAAIAYRGLQRQADAQRMLDKCERLWQEAMAVRSQAALLTAFQRYIARTRLIASDRLPHQVLIASDCHLIRYCTADPVSRFELEKGLPLPPLCQPQLPPLELGKAPPTEVLSAAMSAYLASCSQPAGAGVSMGGSVSMGSVGGVSARGGATFTLLGSLLGLDDLLIEVLRALSLKSKRAAACSCRALRWHVGMQMAQPTLHVRIEDATFENAAFVSRLAHLQALHIEGELFNDGVLDLAKLRTLKRISVGALQFEAALFLG